MGNVATTGPIRLRRILRRGLSAAILLAALTACREQRRPAREPSPAARGRIIVLTDSLLHQGGADTIRFGRMGSGEIAVMRFSLENRTPKPLVIVSTRRSCGCTSLDYDARPIAPGETRTLEMTFDSRGEYGWQLKRMDILFGESGALRLFVEADLH